MEIFKWLNNSALVSAYVIQDFRQSDSAFYLNLKISFKDNSELHLREYSDAIHRKYAFHWQTQSGELITRWDNAPHFQELATYPHHKHLASGHVVESTDISIDEVMTFIELQIWSTWTIFSIIIH